MELKNVIFLNKLHNRQLKILFVGRPVKYIQDTISQFKTFQMYLSGSDKNSEALVLLLPLKSIYYPF